MSYKPYEQYLIEHSMEIEIEEKEKVSLKEWCEQKRAALIAALNEDSSLVLPMFANTGATEAEVLDTITMLAEAFLLDKIDPYMINYHFNQACRVLQIRTRSLLQNQYEIFQKCNEVYDNPANIRAPYDINTEPTPEQMKLANDEYSKWYNLEKNLDGISECYVAFGLRGNNLGNLMTGMFDIINLNIIDFEPFSMGNLDEQFQRLANFVKLAFAPIENISEFFDGDRTLLHPPSSADRAESLIQCLQARNETLTKEIEEKKQLLAHFAVRQFDPNIMSKIGLRIQAELDKLDKFIRGLKSDRIPLNETKRYKLMAVTQLKQQMEQGVNALLNPPEELAVHRTAAFFSPPASGSTSSLSVGRGPGYTLPG